MDKKTARIILFLSCIALCAAFFTPTPALSKYPEKPVEMIVSYPAGGGQDVTFRIVAKFAEQYLGQRIVVVNKVGGGGVIGNTEISRAKPDGYTIGTWHTGLVNEEWLIKGLPYTHKDFIPLVHMAADPHILVVRNNLNMNFQQFIEHAKKNPGKVSIGMGGNWTSHDFFRVKLEKAAGINLLRMPYQGGAPAVQAVAGNNCDSSTPFVPEGLSSVDGKLVTPIAVSSAARNPSVSTVPTCKELGFDVVQVMWRCIVMPLKTPEPVLETLEKVFYQTFQNPEFQETLKKAGGTPIWMDRKEFNKYVEAEYATYTQLIKELGIQAK